jgi:uncharacterized membrane protein YdjX (TVP38/TMEM64 family)
MYRPPTWLRIALVILVVSGAAAAAFAERSHDAAWIGNLLDNYGALAPALFIAAHVVASLVFVPRSVMAIVAGTLWGFWVACLWSLLGAIAGATAGFLLARYVNSGLLVPEEMKRVGPLLQRAESGGWRTVTLVRLIPVLPHALTNYSLGLTRLRLADYVVGSSFGLVPHTFVFVNLGISGRRALDGGAWLEPMLWGLAFLALTMLLPKLLGRRTS